MNFGDCVDGIDQLTETGTDALTFSSNTEALRTGSEADHGHLSCYANPELNNANFNTLAGILGRLKANPAA